MWGIFLKDIILLKKRFLRPRYISIFLILMMVIPFLGESSTVVAIFIVMLIINSIQFLFVDDINSGWLEFLRANTGIPIQKIVFSRFLSAVFICFTANAIFFLMNIGIYMIYKPLPIESYILLGIIVLISSILYMLVSIPFTYLFDQNGPLVVIIILITFGFILGKTSNYEALITKVTSNNYMGISILVGGAIVGCLSFYISTFIYKRRFIK